MKHIFFILTAIVTPFISLAQRKSNSDVHVKGYYRDNGTYVAPYYRTVPNSTNIDNFSTIGNINPYTGKNGTIQPNQSSTNYSSSYHKPYFDNNLDRNELLSKQYYNTTIDVFSCSAIYDKPEETGKQIEQACKGKVTLLSQYNEKYCKVKYENTFGFMEVRWIKLPSENSNNYDTNTFTPKIVEVFTCSAIYDKPEGNGKQIEQACKGKVTLLSQYNEKYYKVKYENIFGFMEVRWIKLPSTNSNNYDTNTFTPKIVEVFTCSAIYDKPDSLLGKIINQACDGKVTIISKFNNYYYKVKYASTIGYLEVRVIK